jgi:hypothetical protein
MLARICGFRFYPGSPAAKEFLHDRYAEFSRLMYRPWKTEDADEVRASLSIALS